MSKYGRWEIFKPLGEGGQGKVYVGLDAGKVDLAAIKRRISLGLLTAATPTQQALDEAAAELAEGILEYAKRDSLENLGALKVLHTSSESGGFAKHLQRMKAEVEALRSVSHPNVIRILDHDLERGWFVMEYFPDGTLGEHLLTFRGNFLSAVTQFRSLVEAVAELHRSGFVHRDIKPENVFMSSRGLVLGDLGLVYFMDEKRIRVSDTFENVGSHDWMPGWAMGMRVEDIRPSFDVFSLGKLLWSMVSGQPKLQLWYQHEDRFELEKMFPDSPDIRWARLILDECIVEKEKDCLPSAKELLAVVDQVLHAVQRNSQVVGQNIRRVCNVCGLGEYQEMSRDVLALAQSFRIFQCQHCGHAEFFWTGGGIRPAWSSRGSLPAPAKVPQDRLEQPGALELRERLQAVDLSVEIISGRAENFVIQVTNHSEEEIRVTRVRLESSAVEISGPAEPPSRDAWKIRPRGTVPIAWRASPDPAASLIRRNLNSGVNFQEEVDVMLRIELSGVTRQITKRLVVQVNVFNRTITHLVG